MTPRRISAARSARHNAIPSCLMSLKLLSERRRGVTADRFDPSSRRSHLRSPQLSRGARAQTNLHKRDGTWHNLSAPCRLDLSSLASSARPATAHGQRLCSSLPSPPRPRPKPLTNLPLPTPRPASGNRSSGMHVHVTGHNDGRQPACLPHAPACRPQRRGLTSLIDASFRASASELGPPPQVRADCPPWPGTCARHRRLHQAPSARLRSPGAARGR